MNRFLYNRNFAKSDTPAPVRSGNRASPASTAWLIGLEILNVGGKPSKSKGNTVTMDDVKVYLTGLDKGALVELAEYMLASLEKAFERVDDSGGAVGMAFEEIAQIYLSACKVAKPDPETLAWKLFSWEVNSEAKSGGCSEHLWMKLAKLREKDCPEDAISVYMKMIEPTLAGKNNDAYKEAVGLLHKIHGLMARIGKGSDFAVYLESVRKAHKPKRNFMKMLDAAKWG